MNFSDLFRSFLGLNRNSTSSDNSNFHNDFRNPIWNIDDDDDTDDELHHNFGAENGNGNFPGGFHIFTNPLEMHRYFEQQMNEILKSFSGIMGSLGEINPPPMSEIPNFSLPSIKEKGEGNIRDEYLKPGYRSPDLSKNKTDSDIDGKISLDDLNSIFGKSEGNSKSVDESPKLDTFSSWNPKNGNIFYGQTIIRRSVTLPDGNIETTQTVKSSDGREETTVTVSPGRGGLPYGEGSIQPFNDIWKSFFGQ